MVLRMQYHRELECSCTLYLSDNNTDPGPFTGSRMVGNVVPLIY